jgi:tRNA threonylcarbamoyladenosine biosynthesis protein TsaE
MPHYTYTSDSQDETERLAEIIGGNLNGGELIELVSDLGGGKTAFVRGLARGMGSADVVGSPTFTISREYRSGNKTLFHYDFYRLKEPGIMSSELAETLRNKDAVVAVEWSDIVKHVLPDKRLTINFMITGETSRLIAINYPEKLNYLIPRKTYNAGTNHTH